MKDIQHFFILFLFSLTMLFFGCSKDLMDEECFYLDGFWSYKTSESDYKTIDVSELENISKYVENKKGYVYLNYNFTIPEQFEYCRLGIYLGSIQLAGSLYINNKYIGKNGRFPEHNFSGNSYSSSFLIPNDCLNFNNEPNSLDIIIWVDGKGGISETPCIGYENHIISEASHSDFFNSKIYLIIGFIIFIFGCIYNILFLLKPKEKSYYSFSQLCFFSWLSMANFFFAEIPIFYKIDYLLFQKIFNGFIPIMTAYYDISFIIDYLSYKDSKTIKVYRFIITLIPVCLVFFSRDLKEYDFFLKIAYGLVGVQMIHSLKIIYKNIKEKNKKVFAILIGFTPVLITILIDACILAYTKHNYIIIITFGWLFVIFFFFDYLLYTFIQTSKKFEFMNNNLEEIVKERTDELTELNKSLTETNTKLSFEKDKSEKEIQLAAYVQQSYFNHNIKQLDDWEISYYFNPLEGVSGDMYDFYYDSNTLHGLGLFDISGHGIAAGLVSMLVKNIIQQEFYLDLSNDLSSVMSLINDRIINEKGNIENYLTGILVRINDKNLELVNAGHPEPFLFSSETKKTSMINKENENQCGVIGLPYVPTNFFTINFKMQSGDILLLYTDGITESKNSEGIDFGKERLMESFNKNCNKQFSKIMEGIFEDFFDFIKNEPLRDDLTLLILKRK